jgi:hypothetical protein
MTQDQLAALFCALPFLSLSFAWLLGLAFLTPRAEPVRVKKEERK